MAAVESRMVELGTTAPPFNLQTANPEIDGLSGDKRSIDDYASAKLLVVVFTCNHCPFAIHVEDALNAIALDYSRRGVQLVAINPNDSDRYPADSFEQMVVRAQEKGFAFPYLRDETQEIARAYQAACTPDTFVFDQDRKLRYRGRVDETRPNSGSATGADLRNALDKLLNGTNIAVDQIPSVGCSIKWRDSSWSIT